MFVLLFIFSLLACSSFAGLAGSASSTIAFTTLGRSRYSFDIFSTSVASQSTETQLTDGVSVNFNGFFPSPDTLLYVSERNGSHHLLLDLLPSIQQIVPNYSDDGNEYDSNYLHPTVTRMLSQGSNNGGFVKNRVDLTPNFSNISMKDRPSLAGENLIYVSTHEPSSSPRQSWSAVYSTHLPTLHITRLTPHNTADFSPAVSPSGDWTAVASESDWSGEVEDLNTDIYIFKTGDGSQRTFIEQLAGWPCWADESTLFFHKRDESGWWSIYRANLTTTNNTISVISIDRITNPGFHAFTPAVSPAAPTLLAIATRRSNSKYRHIELLDLKTRSYTEVTKPLKPYAHHYNPFLSPDGSKIAYHRCRGERNNGNPPLLFETLKTDFPNEFSLFRFDGSFPSFSPDGKYIAFVRLPGLYIAKTDGSGIVTQINPGNAFPTSWDPKRTGVIYTSLGPDFASVSTKVDVISISINNNNNSEPVVKKLTSSGNNNAFPYPSPDGKYIVFRSGRTGFKNLYIMDALNGENESLFRLTEGPWTDTMCNWSPDGEWIAFASDRDDPGAGSFAIYMIHPNGTGLRRLVHSGDKGRTNHPSFSPDSKSIVFTSDLAGVSAEPISNPHHYQPYGEIFTVNIDGSGLRRLTHNSYEDGTPTWSKVGLESEDVSEVLEQGEKFCGFDDCHWLSIEGGENEDGVLGDGKC
ncbi:hypothetical protein LUZ60_005262 [Juncus effusus]|nr:hypothetical protein LUZ60_005262 [Juncus effusus]